MENFKAFIPIDIIEKGEKDKDGLPEKLLISGVASSMKSGKKDKDGHRLNVDGFNFEPFLKSGFFNLEHKGREDYTNIVGEPTNAYVKEGEFHVEGQLYRDNPKAVGIYQLGQILKKSGSTRKIGFSIEGHISEKNPLDPSDIQRSVISGVALTISPKCDGTQMLIKGGEEVEYENQPDSEFLIDITDENGVRITVDKNLEIRKGDVSEELERGGEGSKGGKVIGHTKSEEKMPAGKLDPKGTENRTVRDHHLAQSDKHIDSKVKIQLGGKIHKAMEAGSITGTETHNQSLTQQPLKAESIAGQEGKKKKKKKAIISDVTEMTKSDVLDYLDDLDISDEEKNEVFELAQEIEKGGEGSRGGKVIGHTKGGKAIYNRYDHPEHKGFTPDEQYEGVVARKKHEKKQEGDAKKELDRRDKELTKSEIYTLLINNHSLDIESAKRVYKLAEAIEKAMFHPQNLSHKYIRREGSSGNYTYLYDSPDQKSRDGKSYREGLYSSNVKPKSSKEPKHSIHDKLDKFASKFSDKPKSWKEATGELADIHATMADEHNGDKEEKDKYKKHEGYSKTPEESNKRHKEGIKYLLGKLTDHQKTNVENHYKEWLK